MISTAEYVSVTPSQKFNFSRGHIKYKYIFKTGVSIFSLPDMRVLGNISAAYSLSAQRNLHTVRN
jgi:hypothetical protein